MPVISIIVPVYKVEPYLRRCVDSILAQTFTDFECILIDDGSPDNCPAICDAYAEKDNRITVIHQENRGVSAARNVGLDIAKGEWIGFVDSDDWCDVGMFDFLYNNAIKYDADVSICGIRKVSSNGFVKNKKYKNGICILDRTQAIIKIFEPTAYGGHPVNKLIKSFLLDHYHIRYDETKKYMEDVLFFYTLFKYIQKAVYSTVHFYNYADNLDSVTNQLGLTKSAITGLSVFDEILSIEYDKKIRRKIVTALILFEKNLCLHYIIMKNVDNDNYFLLRKNVKDKIFYVLADFSIPIKVKLVSCLVLYPRMFNATAVLYNRIQFICTLNNKTKFNKK
jgi:glycosyltransferase involved in cell wall biosynthesis